MHDTSDGHEETVEERWNLLGRWLYPIFWAIVESLMISVPGEIFYSFWLETWNYVMDPAYPFISNWH